MKKFSAEETLAYLIKTIETSLTDLMSLEDKSDFNIGQCYGYLECLEVITRWEKAEEYDLNYNPEVRFNVI